MKSVTVSRDETHVIMAITSIAGIVRTHGQEQPEAPAIEYDGRAVKALVVRADGSDVTEHDLITFARAVPAR